MNRHPFDALSAALGAIAIVLGALVITGHFDRADDQLGAWVAVLALVLGLGMIPWTRRQADDVTGTSSTDEDQDR